MAEYACECGGSVEVDTRHLGPHAARGLVDPVKALCSSCVDEKKLTIHVDGGLPWVMLDGREFRFLGGAFVRSEAPESRELYFRDENQRQ